MKAEDPMPADEGLHITVATTATLRGLSLVEELRLVKAALLYADRVTLASFTAGALAAASEVFRGNEAEQHRRLLDIASVLMDEQTKQYVPLLTQRRFRRQYSDYAALSALLDQSVAEVSSVIQALRTQAGIAELETAVAAGLLEIDSLDVDPVAFLKESVARASGREANSEASIVVAAMVRRIGGAVQRGARTYPLFDRGANELVTAMIKAGEGPMATRPAIESGLAGHFVARLPAFPDASVAELIDVRRGLSEPLVRFRGALATMSRTLDAAPWDLGFRDLADSLFASEVEPAMLDLEENARDLGIFSLARHAALGSKPWGAAAATIVVGFTSASSMPDIAAAVLSIGTPLAAAAAGAAEMLKEQRRLARERDSNPFLFLFEADSTLSRGARP